MTLDCEGHCRVAATYELANGYQLGNWVTRQRNNKDTMTAGLGLES